MHTQSSAPAPSHSSHDSHSSQPSPSHTGSPIPPPRSHNEEPRTTNQELPTTLSALADTLGTTRVTVRHYVERLGFRFHTGLIGARRKRAACLTTDQAAAVARAYQADLALGPLPDHAELEPPDHNYGVVYLLQLEPDCDPGRFKVGFSSKPWTRINDLLTVAPLAQCVAMWPARRNWERAAIVAIAQFDTQIREEVFRGANIHDAIRAGDKFFDAMPTPQRAPRRRPAVDPPETSPSSPDQVAHSGAPPGGPPYHSTSGPCRIIGALLAESPPAEAAVCTDVRSSNEPHPPPPCLKA